MSSPSFPVDPSRAAALTDARLQGHHAVQLAVAAGISYLPHQPDDSHTNLEWLPALGALASQTVPSSKPFRIAVIIRELSIHVLDDSNITVTTAMLGGRTIESAAAWLRAQIEARGADPSAFTLAKHYTIPEHALDSGAPFNTTNGGSFDQLSRWYAGANQVLAAVKEKHGGSEVRCWPHHFDIATLIDGGAGASVGVGMEPGDVYYDEPYYYVNRNPRPKQAPSTALDAGGTWHTGEWIGAVLRGSSVTGGAEYQRDQVQRFIDSAIAAYA